MTFFKRENLHNFFWALIVGAIGFAGGLIWKHYDGPDKVIIENPSSIKDTTFTIIKVEGDSSYLALLKNSDLLKFSATSQSKTNDENVLSHTTSQLKLPPVVEGFAQAKLNSYATASIPRSVYSKTELIRISLQFLNRDVLEKISPVFVTVFKIDNSKQMVSQEWEDQFRATGTENNIQISANFAPGKYQLMVGFYLMDEINQKFPPRYLQSFYIEIIK